MCETLFDFDEYSNCSNLCKEILFDFDKYLNCSVVKFGLILTNFELFTV